MYEIDCCQAHNFERKRCLCQEAGMVDLCAAYKAIIDVKARRTYCKLISFIVSSPTYP